MSEAKRVFTIDRATWLRGEGSMKSALRRYVDGKMCCLGSIAKQCGATDEQITGVTSPAKFTEQHGTLPEFDALIERRTQAIPLNSDIASLMMHINDDTSLSDEKREARLIELGNKLGWDLQFTGEGK